MITRLASLVALVYALGFVVFAFTLGKPAAADASPTDAAVVLTGGSGRIEHAIDVLRDGKARRLLVAGADPSVTKADLARRLRRKPQADSMLRRPRQRIRRHALQRRGGRTLALAAPVSLAPADHQRLAHAPRAL